MISTTARNAGKTEQPDRRPLGGGFHAVPVRLWAVLFWLAAWQLGAMALDKTLSISLLPTPLAAAARWGELVLTLPFWRTVGWSALRILGGFFLGCAAAGLLAPLAARFRRVAELLEPLVAVVKATPVASFIILALLWVPKSGLSLFTAFLMVFPVVYQNLLSGILHTDPALLEMAQVFRIPLGRQIPCIYIPQILPWFRSACSLGLGLCWKAGVAAEVIGLPAGSLGERLYTAKIYLETPDLFAWTATIVGLAVLFEKLFVRLLDALAKEAGA